MKKVFREISLQEFESFAKDCPSKNYMQSPPMYQRYQIIGRESYLFGLVVDGDVVVAGVASVIYERYGRKIFTFSRGPLVSQQASLKDLILFLQECKEVLKAKKGIVLQISPNLLVQEAPKNYREALKKAHFKYLGEYEQVKWIYAIDFSKIEGLPKVAVPKNRTSPLDPIIEPKDEQTLFRHFRRDHRYSIRYATERYGVKLRQLEPSEYDVMIKLINESGKKHGFVPRDQKFFEQLADVFGQEVVAIVAEMPDGTPAAAAFFILYGNEVIYLSSGMSREHKKYCAPHLIQWAMIKYAYANGYQKYNFWGTNPDPEDGVFNFKQGFHGEVEEFIGTFAAPLSPLGAVYLKKLHQANHRDL